MATPFHLFDPIAICTEQLVAGRVLPVTNHLADHGQYLTCACLLASSSLPVAVVIDMINLQCPMVIKPTVVADITEVVVDLLLTSAVALTLNVPPTLPAV